MKLQLGKTYKVCRLKNHQNHGIHFVGEHRKVVMSYKGNKIGLLAFLDATARRTLAGGLFTSFIAFVTYSIATL